MKPCGHANTDVVADCTFCWLVVHDARFQELWCGDGAPHTPARIGTCRHLGPPVGERDCPSCGNRRVKLKTYRCAVHNAIVLRDCETCPDFARFEPITTRHLLYHVYPVRGNGVWQRRIAQLRDRLSLFNGRRIVAIVADPPAGRGPDPSGCTVPTGCDPPAAVIEALAGCGCEFVIADNDPSLREAATFDSLFGRLADCTGPGEAALYAQAKGVTRPVNSPPQWWGDLLIAGHCDYWPAAERVLRSFPVAGMFKKHGRGWKESASDWHYSGSWFWFRTAALWPKNWRRIDRFWSGIEPYPSLHFPAAEAGVIFGEGNITDYSLYDLHTWNDRIWPAWAQWQADHAGQRHTLNSGIPHRGEHGHSPATALQNRLQP